MRETMRIMSMKTTAYGLSYFFTQAIFAVITSFMISITFLALGVFGRNPWGTFLQFLIAVLIYGLTTIFQSMALSTLFSDSKIASQVGSLVLIVPMAIY